MKEETIKSWQDLADLAWAYRERHSERWIFRGVPDRRFGLVPRIGRKGTRSTERTYDLDDERQLFKEFKRPSSAFLEGSPHNLDLLVIAQHHGLPTRYETSAAPLPDCDERLLISAVEGG